MSCHIKNSVPPPTVAAHNYFPIFMLRNRQGKRSSPAYCSMRKNAHPFDRYRRDSHRKCEGSPMQLRRISVSVRSGCGESFGKKQGRTQGAEAAARRFAFCFHCVKRRRPLRRVFDYRHILEGRFDTLELSAIVRRYLVFIEPFFDIIFCYHKPDSEPVHFLEGLRSRKRPGPVVPV